MATATEDLRIANAALNHLGIGRVGSFDTETSEAGITLNDQYDTWVDELLEDHPWNFATTRVTLANYEWAEARWNDTTDQVAYVSGRELPTWTTNMGPFRLTTDDTLPSGLAEDTNYYMIVASATTLSLSLTIDGSAVNFTDDGTGTHTVRRYSPYEWSYAHMLPYDCLRIIKVEEHLDEYEWTVEDGAIFHNIGTSVNIRYTRSVDMSSAIAPLFKRALSLKIAMDLAESGVKTTSVMKEVEEKYYKALQRAKSKNGQEKSPSPQPTGTWAIEAGRES